MRLKLDQQNSPIGTIFLVSDDLGVLHALDFEDHEERMRKLLKRYYGAVDLDPGCAPESIRTALEAYFDGKFSALIDLPTGSGGTAFQKQVWSQLRKIPVGETVSYGQLATALGRPGASRAVGLANGANPVAIVVPCHRVIGANGALTGFGGGLPRKQWLLEHEHAVTPYRLRTGLMTG